MSEVDRTRYYYDVKCYKVGINLTQGVKTFSSNVDIISKIGWTRTSDMKDYLGQGIYFRIYNNKIKIDTTTFETFDTDRCTYCDTERDGPCDCRFEITDTIKYNISYIPISFTPIKTNIFSINYVETALYYAEATQQIRTRVMSISDIVKSKEKDLSKYIQRPILIDNGKNISKGEIGRTSNIPLEICGECNKTWLDCKCEDIEEKKMKKQVLFSCLTKCKSIKKLDEIFECNICSNKLDYEGDIKTTKCMHKLCEKCFWQIYRKENKCPMCRGKML